MATCGSSLSSLFEKPLPENPTLIESLSSRAQIMARKPIDPARFIEIFGELHFHEKPDRSCSSSSLIDRNCTGNGGKASLGSKRCSNEAFLMKNSDSFQLCTEGLGSESSDDVDDVVMESEVVSGDSRREEVDGADSRESSLLLGDDEDGINGYSSRIMPPRAAGGGRFPPPIAWLGRPGKPWIWFKSYKVNGRFIMREMRIPTQEFLQASRRDGRLKLHLVQPDDDDDEEEGKECQKDQEHDQEEELISENPCQ